MLDVETFEVVASFRIIVGTSSATAVKSIEFARRGEYVEPENFTRKSLTLVLFQCIPH